MRLILHQVLKDLRILKSLLLAWAASLALFYGLFFYPFAAGPFDHVTSDRLHLISAALSYLAAVLFVVVAALLVQNDAPASPTAFWVTRPISGRTMLATKLLAALAILCVLPVAADAIAFVLTGMNPLDFPLRSAAYVLVWLLPLLAVAAATVGLPQFVLVMTIEILLVSIVTGGVYQFWRNERAMTLFALGAPIVGLGVLVLACQYLTRRTKHAAVVLGVAPVAIAGVAIVLSPPAARPSALTEPPELRSVSVVVDRSRLHVADLVMARTIEVPLTVTGVPPGSDYTLVPASSWLQRGDQRSGVGSVPRSAVQVGVEEPDRDARRVFGDALAGTTLVADHVRHRKSGLTLVVGKGVAERLGEPMTLHLNVRVLVQPYRAVATVALRRGATFQAPGTRGEVMDVFPDARREVVTLRQVVSGWPVAAGHFRSRALLLRNRRYGQSVVVEDRVTASAGADYANIAFFAPIPQALAVLWREFALSSDTGRLAAPPREWIKDADVVLYDVGYGATATRTIEVPDVVVR